MYLLIRGGASDDQRGGSGGDNEVGYVFELISVVQTGLPALGDMLRRDDVDWRCGCLITRERRVVAERDNELGRLIA